tara:strand:+ start:58 stop:1413 length:1356 start_codon:yes stop_codon:yes gene_type:complete
MSRARDIANLQSGGVINDASADLDFRIESNGLTHALFVDGGTDTVTIGTSSTDAYSSADNLVVGTGSGHNGITIFSANANQGTIFFADALGGDSDASTYDGYIIYDHSARHFRFGTAGGERVRINSDGDLLLGSSTDAGYGPLQIGSTSTASTILQMLAADDGYNTIHFGDGTSGTARYRGYVQYNMADEAMMFATGATERMRIDSSGKVGIGTNSPSRNLTVSSSSQTDLAIVAGTSSSAQLCFGDSGDDNIGQIEYNNSSNYMALYTNTTEHIRIHSNGNVKIGQNTGTLLDNCPLQIEREESSNDSCVRTKNPSTNSRFHFDFWNSSGTQGNITVNASSVNFNSTSDYRKKENVNYDWDGTTEIKKLKPAKFNFIGSSDTIQGFLAHEVSSVVPIAVTGEKDGTEKYTDEDGKEKTREVYQSMDVSKLVPLLVKTIQELEARIAKLEE